MHPMTRATQLQIAECFKTSCTPKRTISNSFAIDLNIRGVASNTNARTHHVSKICHHLPPTFVSICWFSLALIVGQGQQKTRIVQDIFILFSFFDLLWSFTWTSLDSIFLCEFLFKLCWQKSVSVKSFDVFAFPHDYCINLERATAKKQTIAWTWSKNSGS